MNINTSWGGGEIAEFRPSFQKLVEEGADPLSS